MQRREQIDLLYQTISEVLEIDKADLLGSSRKESIVDAKKIFIEIACNTIYDRENSTTQAKYMAEELGRDRTTIMHLRKGFYNLFVYPKFYEKYNGVQSKFYEKLKHFEKEAEDQKFQLEASSIDSYKFQMWLSDLQKNISALNTEYAFEKGKAFYLNPEDAQLRTASLKRQHAALAKNCLQALKTYQETLKALLS